ncbi:capsular glucan synthase [mine drainage metagenome]|uniref:Capsular glucan synthase n=1 Tax=mine drainage metagenome TaxID=410659 RepID=A0A1J5PD23_9ZZZZ
MVAAHPDAQILLFGQGPLLKAITARVQASPLLRQHVRLPGFRRDLDRILPALDVLAHPAFMEGLGVSLLQAAACGVPIVAGRAGGIPEIVRPGINGELIEPGDTAALTRALIELLASSELRARYGLAGRQRVIDQFSIDAMVNGNLAVYRQVSAAP